ncbi:RHS repeat domain-containing protein [Alteromonas sp. 14N.309.X.WAT.G.H12]|uniref:RHS repeat domain-containing protein n=1 Tax=Alteromonas sp. 14N.309.X.WAT.G.H12 TaxID=3120824 RepID=UPI002FD31319
MRKKLKNSFFVFIILLISLPAFSVELVPISVGNIIIFVQAADFKDENLKVTFQYDARGRLIQTKNQSDEKINYEYDDAGNRTRVNN